MAQDIRQAIARRSDRVARRIEGGAIMTWKYHTPERDGHAPDDWNGIEIECLGARNKWIDVSACPAWVAFKPYRYRPLQDATYEPDLLAQCLALPQDQREALIEAMQKPQRDWADDVWEAADEAYGNGGKKAAAAVIRSMCQPKDDCLKAQVAAIREDGVEAYRRATS